MGVGWEDGPRQSRWEWAGATRWVTDPAQNIKANGLEGSAFKQCTRPTEPAPCDPSDRSGRPSQAASAAAVREPPPISAAGRRPPRPSLPLGAGLPDHLCRRPNHRLCRRPPPSLPNHRLAASVVAELAASVVAELPSRSSPASSPSLLNFSEHEQVAAEFLPY